MDKGNEITLEHLTIETTRRCNMKCAHCLRGDAQNIDINLQHIDDLLDQVELVGQIFITGGEPTLNLDAMAYIADSLSMHGIPIYSFGVTTNALIYSEQFIEIIKRYKEMIDFSRNNCFSAKSKHPILDSIPTCTVGVSLDRYHEQHDLCFENYEKYKDALRDYADVRMIRVGNAVANYGRAKNLQEKVLNEDYKDVLKYQRIEVLSKDIAPACKYYNTFQMSYKDQKIVCCELYMNAYGNITSGYYGSYDYKRNQAAPIICKANDPLWESIIKYNEDRFPCVMCQKILNEKATEHFFQNQEDLSFLLDKDAQNEESNLVKKIKEDGQRKLYNYEHPKSFWELLENVLIAYREYKDAQSNLKKLNMNDNKDWKDIFRAANRFAYYYGDNRGNVNKV